MGWYYGTDGILSYDGFCFFENEEHVDTFEWNHGPFKTFTEAKENALDRIRTDREFLIEQAKEIRALRKSEVEKR